MVRPVVAPYHKATGVGSLGSYVPYIPGKTTP
jgi:hypothetical protein